MSITGAVTELNKEIERLTAIRDSLLKGSQELTGVASRPAPAKKASSAKKAASVTKSAATKSAAGKSAPAKKRILSPEARKRISDANKARWAAVRKAKGGK